MFRALCLLLVTVLGSASAQHGQAKASITRWPQDRDSAISLTFDDGINTDLDYAGPILKKHHLNGTFFVTTAMGPWEKRKAEWKRLALDGNELANHTVHHPCLLAQITPHAQDYTPAMMEAEITGAAQELVQALGTRRGLTFAYPCGNMSFGKPSDEVKNAALYTRYVSENSFGARGVGVGPANPDELNVLDVNDLGPTADKGFVELLKLAEPAFQSHNWGVFCFHGIGGDWLSITPEALDELTGYLERHPEIWTATFGDVLRYVQERKAASVQITRDDSSSLTLVLQLPINREIYDVPLTLKVQLPAIWNKVRVEGDGKLLNAKTAIETNATTVLVDVPAQTQIVTVTEQPQ